MAFNELGLVIPRAPEILTDIQDYQVANVTPKFKYQNNKIIYQLNSVYALQASQMAELIEAAFDSTKLSSAEGYHLEELGLLRGVYRAQAVASSTSSQWAWMTNGRSIPSGTVFASSTLSNTAVTTSNIVALPSSCNAFRFKIKSVVSSSSYTVTINGVSYSYTSDSDATKEEIRAGIVAQFDADTTRTFTYVEETDYIEITADDDTSLIASIATSLLEINQVKVYFYLQASETGEIDYPANTMDTVSTPVVGLIETNNDEDFSLGSEIESDEDFRLSIQAGNSSACTGTVLTIEAELEKVSGVTYATVIENTDESPTDVDGRPIHSYESLVVGGSDEDVASIVWITKPTGIQLWGNTVVSHTDTSGVVRAVEFSRPSKVNIAVLAEYTLYNEEVFPDDGDEIMQAAIVSYISSLPLGKDIIPLRIANVASSAVEGIETMVINLQVLASSGDPTDPFAWQTTPISVSATEYAYTELVDVVMDEV